MFKTFTVWNGSSLSLLARLILINWTALCISIIMFGDSVEYLLRSIPQPSAANEVHARRELIFARNIIHCIIFACSKFRLASVSDSTCTVTVFLIKCELHASL